MVYTSLWVILPLVACVPPTDTKGELSIIQVTTLSLTNNCTTVVLLLLTVTHHVQSVAMHTIPYGCTKFWEDMRHPGRWFWRQVKLLTMGYTACSVNGA